MPEPQNPKPNTEIVLSMRILEDGWHVAVLRNQRMESVYKAKTLAEAMTGAEAILMKESYTDGTRVILTTVIVPPTSEV